MLIALGTPKQPAAMVLLIIGSYAPVNVAYAAHGETIVPRRIYLSPPGKHLVVNAGGVMSIDGGSSSTRAAHQAIDCSPLLPLSSVLALSASSSVATPRMAPRD